MGYSLLVVFCEILGIHHSMIILDSLISEVLQLLIWIFAPLTLNISAAMRYSGFVGTVLSGGRGPIKCQVII